MVGWGGIGFGDVKEGKGVHRENRNDILCDLYEVVSDEWL